MGMKYLLALMFLLPAACSSPSSYYKKDIQILRDRMNPRLGTTYSEYVKKYGPTKGSPEKGREILPDGTSVAKVEESVSTGKWTANGHYLTLYFDKSDRLYRWVMAWGVEGKLDK